MSAKKLTSLLVSGLAAVAAYYAVGYAKQEWVDTRAQQSVETQMAAMKKKAEETRGDQSV